MAAIAYFLLFALSIGKVFSYVAKYICRPNTKAFSSLPYTTAGAGTYSLSEDQGLPIKNATTSTTGKCMYRVYV